MGQCYSINLHIKVKDKKGAIKALQQKIAHGKEDHTNYSLDHYKEIGITPDNLIDLLRIIFGGWDGRLNLTNLKTPGFATYQSDFECCYGWEGIMIDAFNVVGPYLEDGSSISIYPDSGVDKAVVKDGKVKWIS